MKLTFNGAAGEVTGSCYHLQTDRASILIDCGLFQGSIGADLKNRRGLPFDVHALNAIILTHAHLDHSGRLPLVVKDGYKGRIWCTPATMPLTDILLKDAGHLQVEEAERMNRRRQRGRGTAGPRAIALYDEDQARQVVPLCSTLPYEKEQEVAPGIRVKCVDAGHILGSASLQVVVTEKNGNTKTIVFSGDIGERNTPILHDPHKLPKADVVVLESTYGDRDHRSQADTIAEFRRIVNDCSGPGGCGGKLLMPAFAVGRTQTLVYHLAAMQRDGQLGSAPVFVDSPMAVAVTKLYQSHKELFDEPALDLLSHGINPLSMPQLRMSISSDESRQINDLKGPAIIIAGAGMCNGGRILHHLRHNLAKPETRILIAGYQANGTLGRRLVDGEKIIKIYGEPIMVRATIHTLGGFSAHGGQSTLIDWFSSLAPSKPRVFLTHGEDKQRQTLAAELTKRFGVSPALPKLYDSVEL